MSNTNQLPLFSSPTNSQADDLWSACIAPAVAGWRITAEKRGALHIAEGRAELAAILEDSNANHGGMMPLGWQTRITVTISRGIC